MSVEDIERAITALPAAEVAQLMSWIAGYYQDLWDGEIEEDLESGKLDGLLAEVDSEYEAGLAKPL